MKNCPTKTVKEHLDRINESEKKINFLISKSFPKNHLRLDLENAENQPSKAFKIYIKKKINKAYGELEKALDYFTFHKGKSFKRSSSSKFSSIYTIKEKEENNEEKIDRIQLKKSPSIRSQKKFGQVLTPVNKSKFMKDYYFNIVKPNHSPQSRKSKLLHQRLFKP